MHAVPGRTVYTGCIYPGVYTRVYIGVSHLGVHGGIPPGCTYGCTSLGVPTGVPHWVYRLCTGCTSVYALGVLPSIHWVYLGVYLRGVPQGVPQGVLSARFC